MLEEQRDRFYYVTIMNANDAQPSMPEVSGIRDGVLKGMYRLPHGKTPPSRVQLLGSGAIMTEVLIARDLLGSDWNIAAAVWSVTSYVELHRDGIDCERRARLQPNLEVPQAFVTETLSGCEGPIIAASDYVRALPELIRAFVPGRYVTLGTDGFGRSDTRAALRAFFEVDAVSIVIATLKAVADEGMCERRLVAEALRKYGRDVPTDAPWVR
jgi:pyruvate dehydrogenase E1 component